MLSLGGEELCAEIQIVDLITGVDKVGCQLEAVSILTNMEHFGLR